MEKCWHLSYGPGCEHDQGGGREENGVAHMRIQNVDVGYRIRNCILCHVFISAFFFLFSLILLCGPFIQNFLVFYT